MNTTQLEIAALRRGEARQEANSTEADRLIRELLPYYACDFVVAELPDGGYARLPVGWQSEISGPVEFHYGMPPRNERGAIAVSLATLRMLRRPMT